LETWPQLENGLLLGFHLLKGIFFLGSKLDYFDTGMGSWRGRVLHEAGVNEKSESQSKWVLKFNLQEKKARN
jgi:hypothetical protein